MYPCHPCQGQYAPTVADVHINKRANMQNGHANIHKKGSFCTHVDTYSLLFDKCGRQSVMSNLSQASRGAKASRI